MKLHDTFSGLLAVILGAAVIAHARTFPAMPGQTVGPAFFPTVVGCGFVVFGLALVAAGRRRERAAWVRLDDWARRPRRLLDFALVILDLLLYALLVDRLGFFITAMAFLAILWLAFGVKRRWIVPLGLAVTFGIHYAFYSLLRVPLPWGPLGGIAW